MSATIEQVKAAVDATASKSGFRCVPVSWEDCARSGSGNGGFLSSVGPNISDVRLYEKGDKTLFTLRSQNWNERLGYVAARDVALVTGNEKSEASALSNTTLADWLANAGARGRYAGLTTPSLAAPGTDEIFGIRFQTVFLPVAGSADAGLERAFGLPPPSTEFCTEVYNYQTRQADDPRNLLLLATPQGLSVQADGPGRQRVYFHSVDGAGTVHRYWLEAEKSEQKVGGEQKESQEEALAAAQRGKATAVRLGPAAMGTRFNVQMLIQVPLQQRPPPQARSSVGCFGGGRGRGGGGGFGASQAYAVPAAAPSSGFAFSESSDADDCVFACSAKRCRRPGGPPQPAPKGVSNAARVSRGTEHDTWKGLVNPAPTRDASQHGTITVTMYYTVVGGVPSVADVERAVKDLDALYKAMPSDKRLAQCDEVLAKPKGIPPPPAAPGVFKPAAPANVARCRSGHTLAAIYGGASDHDEPPQGWFCDGCGVFVAPGAAASAKGYGCRACDFDLCPACAVAPQCPQRHPLLRLPFGTFGAPNVTCGSCNRQYAVHHAVMRGCACGAGGMMCEACFAMERVKKTFAH